MQQRLTAARHETGVLVITHYERILNYIKPGFVHILFGGRIVESGTFDELIRLNGGFAEVARTRAPELARNAVCPAHYMGIVELYRTTRDRRYLALARTLVDLRDRVEDGTDDS